MTLQTVTVTRVTKEIEFPNPAEIDLQIGLYYLALE